MIIFSLFAGLFLLITGAHFLVEGGLNLAHSLKVKSLIIGLTVIALGTSLPELAVNINASVKDADSIVLGNIIGSNIANILLILGLSALIKPLEIRKPTTKVQIPIMIVSTFALFIFMLISANSSLSKWIGGLFILVFFGFIFNLQNSQSNSSTSRENEVRIWLLTIQIIGGLGLLIYGAVLSVESAQIFARSIGVSERIIALSIIAIGTSLPELATSTVAAYKHQDDIAVGNVVGSNIFNLLFILGLSLMIQTIHFSQLEVWDVLILLLSTSMLYVCVITSKKRRLTRMHGVAFLGIYLLYISYLLLV